MRSRLAIALLLLAGLGGFDDDGARIASRMVARRTVIERPELWSVRAVGQAGGPVRICANKDMRSGFIRPSPAICEQACRLVGEAVRTANGWAFRCSSEHDTYAVSSAATGNLARAFETQISITPLQGRRSGYHQTLRYVRLGACPAGWAIGQATDRRDVKLKSALVPWTSRHPRDTRLPGHVSC